MAWMQGPYESGVYNKDLPGFYYAVKVNANNFAVNTDRGVLSCPIELEWGKDGEIITVTAEEYSTNAFEIFGYTAGSKELKLVDEMFRNASVLQLYRLNSGGEKAKGTFGTAKNSGEFGNKITVVVEEDPDNPEG